VSTEYVETLCKSLGAEKDATFPNMQKDRGKIDSCLASLIILILRGIIDCDLEQLRVSAVKPAVKNIYIHCIQYSFRMNC